MSTRTRYLRVQPWSGAATSPVSIGRRRLILTALTILVTALAAIAPVALYARHGFDALEIAALGLFLVLITAIACWFSSAAIGFWVLLTGREQEDLKFRPHPPEPTQRTALLMPLYNEDARAAFARLAVIDSSLARLGVSDAFDIFVLSDSTKAEAADQEHQAYLGFRAHAHSRVFYRRREKNTERKAGNIADWTRTFPHLTEAMQPGWIAAHPARAASDGAEADRIGLQIARAFVAQIDPALTNSR